MLGQDPCKVSLYSAAGSFITDLTRYLTEGSFSRKKKDVSIFNGVFETDQGQTSDLGKIDTWATYIVCERDDRDQWSGPVSNVVFDGSKATVVGSDKTVYWARTPAPTGNYVVKDVTDIAEDMVTRAYDTHLYAMPEFSIATAGIVVTDSFDLTKYKYLSDVLSGLPGLNWTAFGETVFFFGLEDNPNSIFKLTDMSWSPLPAVELAGQAYANQVIVVGKGVVGIAEAPQDEIEYRGLLTRIYDASDATTQNAVDNLAAGYLARTRDSTYLNTDNAAVLSPKTNISLAELIPGNCVDIDHSVGIYSLRRQLRIDEVNVDCITGDVSCTFEPLSVPDTETIS